MEELLTYMQNGMKAADLLLMKRLPAYQRMMKHAGALLNISPLLAARLTRSGSISCSPSVSLPLEPTLFVPAMPLVCLTAHSPRSLPTTNFATFSQAVDASPTPTPLEDFDAFDAIPLVIGLPTMTEIVDQFMEDLLTQEFSPIVLAEDS